MNEEHTFTADCENGILASLKTVTCFDCEKFLTAWKGNFVADR